MIRIGIGYDSHRFADDRPLVLGGIVIPDSPGLTGHSDGDAIAHAVTDALLGAVGAGDIGKHFPPDRAEWAGADSIDLLTRAARVVRDLGWQAVNVDATVICERPKIGPHADAMRARLAGALGIADAAVSVKGKTNEGMGWIGAGEGIAVHAVALVERIA